ncbi:MAG TPA: hypothetical protein PLB45_01665 [Bacilli bacterium]|nr:hypothetical protein [Bacilli bacterium]
MKNIFVNEDGTIKMATTLIFVTIFNTVILLLLFSTLFTTENITSNNKVTTTTEALEKSTTTIKVCNDCKINFNLSSIDVIVNGSTDINSFIDLDKISLQNVNFTIGDESYITIDAYGSTFMINAKGKVGSTVVTAYYGDVSSTFTVNVVDASSRTVTFTDDIYYCYLKRTLKADLSTYPYGSTLGTVTYDSADKNIVTANKKTNSFSCKALGETTISLNDGNNTDTATVIVNTNMVTIKVLNGSKYVEKNHYNYPSDTSSTIKLSVTIEDKGLKGYNHSSLSVDVVNQGSMSTTLNYTEDSSVSKTYLYDANVNLSDNSGGSSTITFKLPDGSMGRINIVK